PSWLHRNAFGERPVKPLPAVEQIRDRPAGDEDANDQITEIGETAVERADEIPERAFEAELAGDQSECLDAADHERDNNRNRRDGEVVPDFPDRIEESPTVGADHQHAVGGVD